MGDESEQAEAQYAEVLGSMTDDELRRQLDGRMTDEEFYEIAERALADKKEEPKEDPVVASYEGLWARFSCGACGDMFEVEDDVSNGDHVRCDACGAEQIVERFT